MGIGLSPGGRDIHLEFVGNASRAVANRSNTASPARIDLPPPRKGDPVSLDREIKIPGLPLQQEIADNSTDEINDTPPSSARFPSHEAGNDVLRETAQQRSSVIRRVTARHCSNLPLNENNVPSKRRALKIQS